MLTSKKNKTVTKLSWIHFRQITMINVNMWNGVIVLLLLTYKALKYSLFLSYFVDRCMLRELSVRALRGWKGEGMHPQCKLSYTLFSLRLCSTLLVLWKILSLFYLIYIFIFVLAIKAMHLFYLLVPLAILICQGCLYAVIKSSKLSCL